MVRGTAHPTRTSQLPLSVLDEHLFARSCPQSALCGPWGPQTTGATRVGASELRYGGD